MGNICNINAHKIKVIHNKEEFDIDGSVQDQIK